MYVVGLIWLRLLSVPPTALVSSKVKPSGGGALKVNVTVAVPWARFRSVLSIDTVTGGSMQAQRVVVY